MALIRQDYLDDLYAAADDRLVEVINHFGGIALKKSGGGHNYTACCPFHDEKTPSFVVTPQKRRFKCFGCGEGGSAGDSGSAALWFIRKKTDMRFPEAVSELARHIGFREPEFEAETEASKQAQLIKNALNDATRHFRRSLLEHKEIAQHLIERGITREDVKKFGLGYAPPGNTLIQSLKSSHFFNVLEAAGLIGRDQENPKKIYDFFRSRIMFPIQKANGDVIGFSGRHRTKKPKYQNSPNTDYFHKSEVLYGWHQMASATNPEPGVANVVEGYMDVIAMHRHGLSNTVATMGTALTESNLRRLAARFNHIRFVFDGDKAGQDAARRAVEAAIPHLTPDLRVTVALLPAGQDPDEMLLAGNLDTLTTLLKRSTPGHEFLIKQATKNVDYTDPYAVAGIDQRLREVFSTCTNDPLRKVMVNYLQSALLQLQQTCPQNVIGKTKPILDRLDPAWAAVIKDAQPEYVNFVSCVLAEPDWLRIQHNYIRPGSEAFPVEANLAELMESAIREANRKNRAVRDAFDSQAVNDVVAYLIDSGPRSLSDKIRAIATYNNWGMAAVKKTKNIVLLSASN